MNSLIKCPICKNAFRSLNSHVYFKHHVQPEELKRQFPELILVSDRVKKKTSRSCKKAGCGRTAGFTMPDAQKQKISDAMVGERNHFYGKKHSEATRRKMSKNHADFTGNKNPLVRWLKSSSKNRETYSRKMRELWAREDMSEVLSKRQRTIVTNAIKNGNYHPHSNHIHGWFKSKKFGKRIYYQSSYELGFLIFCEKSDKICSLQRPEFVIPYVDNNRKDRVYNPDFLVNGKVLVEIKPKGMMRYNNNTEKVAAGKVYCKKQNLEFRLLTEWELTCVSEMSWTG